MARWDEHSTRDPEKVWSKIDFDGPCWEWRASRTSNGYGYIRWGGKFRRAHRVVWEILVGPIPDGLSLDHLCRNKICVNPDHLEPVTHRENVLRGVSPFAESARRTHCPRGHEYSGENTYLDRGRRRCRKCLAAKARRYRQRKKENNGA